MSLFIDEIVEENTKLKEENKKLKEENAKSKKVIKRLKRNLDLNLDPILLTLNSGNEILLILNEEDFDLLEEYLGND